MSRDLLAVLSDRAIPVFNASMAGAAGPRLAGAVSDAGGVGMLGVSSSVDTPTLARSAASLHEAGAVWGAGFMSFALDKSMAPLDAVLTQQPAVTVLGFGISSAAVELVRTTECALLIQVGNVEEFQNAAAVAPDGIIVRGGEGGGHGRNEISTFTLLQLALDRTDIPIIAGGGITTARGLAAVVAAGASAAWIGTRFAAALESDFTDAARDRVIASTIGDTVYTRVFDIAQGAAWPPHYGGRALSNDFSRDWHERVTELESKIATTTDSTAAMLEARRTGNFDIGPIYAGEGSGLISQVESAAEIMADLARYRTFIDAAR